MPTRILHERCSLCGTCIYQCGSDVYEIAYNGDSLKVLTSGSKNCVDCCICMERCPENAIELFFRGEKYSLEKSDFQSS